MMNQTRTIFFAVSFFAFCAAAFPKSEEQAVRTADLTKQQSSWLAVSGGTVVAPPVETDYGFAVFTDGRMIFAFSDKGTVLWQKAVNGRQSPYLAAFGDFLYVITANKKLNLVNPSGLTLWTADVGFDVIESPFVGRDGRVFVRGKNALACYGLNGIRKWIIVTSDAGKIPLLECNDGSLLVLSNQLKEGKSTGIRISPFGEILETITFTGKIIAAASCKDGILLSQDDETIGLCSVIHGTAESVWVANSLAKSNFTHIAVAHDGETAAFFNQKGKKTSISLVAINTGTLIAQAELGELQLKNLSYLRATKAGFYLSDEKRAIECEPNGTLIWQTTLPKKNKWDYAFYNAQNYLILCQKDWSLRAYLMNQTVEKKPVAPAQTERPSYVATGAVKSTIGSMNLDHLSSDALTTISTALSQGDYGANEQAWLSAVKTEMQSYFLDASAVLRSSHDGMSYFKANPVYTQSLIQIMAQSGTDAFAEEFATLLETEKEPSRLALAIQEAGKQGYDGDGTMLAAFETIAAHKLTARDQNTLKILCDATYEICRFMGRPALATKGRTILGYLFFPQFDKTIRDYARETLARLKDLGL